MSKTILHLTGMRSTKCGALEHYFLYLAKLARDRGFRTVLQYKAPPASRTYVEELTRLGAQTSVRRLEGGLLRTLWAVTGLLWNYRPDVLMLHFPGDNDYLTYVTPVLARLFRVRRVVRMVHGLHTPPLQHGREWALSKFDHILCVSDAVTERFRMHGYRPNNLRTHYLGLIGEHSSSAVARSSIRQEFGIPAAAIVIGTTVFDNPIKGLDILIKSFAVLHGRMPEAHLLIVGVDPTVAENAKLTTTLGIASVTHWAAIRDDGWRYLNAADIYVQPSRSEGLGLAIIEAMALELPVVASRVGGIPEAVEDGVSGALVPPEDEAALSNKLQELAQNGTLRNAMGKAGQQRYLEHFRGETSAQVLLERYADIAP